MILDINVCTSPRCAVIIYDKSVDYLTEASTAKNKFRYQDTVSVDLLQLNRSTGAELQQAVFTVRTEQVEQVKIPVNFDGWFTICHIVVPSKEWFDAELSKSTASALGLYDTVYYSDGVNIYKYRNNSSEPATIEEVVNRNPENTTISIVKKNYVSVCFLRKCYINLCQQLFNSNIYSECFDKSGMNSELIHQRDLVWMALNVIQYLTEFNQLAEAERIIEQLQGCNGVCKQTIAISKQGCGCS